MLELEFCLISLLTLNSRIDLKSVRKLDKKNNLSLNFNSEFLKNGLDLLQLKIVRRRFSWEEQKTLIVDFFLFLYRLLKSLQAMARPRGECNLSASLSVLAS